MSFIVWIYLCIFQFSQQCLVSQKRIRTMMILERSAQVSFHYFYEVNSGQFPLFLGGPLMIQKLLTQVSFSLFLGGQLMLVSFCSSRSTQVIFYQFQEVNPGYFLLVLGGQLRLVSIRSRRSTHDIEAVNSSQFFIIYRRSTHVSFYQLQEVNSGYFLLVLGGQLMLVSISFRRSTLVSFYQFQEVNRYFLLVQGGQLRLVSIS